jgi:hypothetical protein
MNWFVLIVSVLASLAASAQPQPGGRPGGTLYYREGPRDSNPPPVIIIPFIPFTPQGLPPTPNPNPAPPPGGDPPTPKPQPENAQPGPGALQTPSSLGAADSPALQVPHTLLSADRAFRGLGGIELSISPSTKQKITKGLKWGATEAWHKGAEAAGEAALKQVLIESGTTKDQADSLSKLAIAAATANPELKTAELLVQALASSETVDSATEQRLMSHDVASKRALDNIRKTLPSLLSTAAKDGNNAKLETGRRLAVLTVEATKRDKSVFVLQSDLKALIHDLDAADPGWYSVTRVPAREWVAPRHLGPILRTP